MAIGIRQLTIGNWYRAAENWQLADWVCCLAAIRLVAERLAGCLAGLRVAVFLCFFGHDWVRCVPAAWLCVLSASLLLGCLPGCLAGAGLGCIGLGLVRLGWAELARIVVMATGN